MHRLCGRSAVAAAPVSGERERGNREVAPVSGVSWRTKARGAAPREAPAYARCAGACST
jgi:hypothetical protein